MIVGGSVTIICLSPIACALISGRHLEDGIAVGVGLGIGSLLFWLGLRGFNYEIAGSSSTKMENGPKATRSHSVEDRLDELERLKRRDMVTPEEYAAKRQEILKDL